MKNIRQQPSSIAVHADNTLCIACGETLLNEGMWNDIPGRRGTCDMFCQYTILINDWVKKGTPIEATWRRAVQ
ncbi:hypothetical protein G9A89_022120 [Geosiphon pyriformis]|nr:hypothetical protein G9A89_022120 [Geosiphon pyriformis]